MHFKKLFKFINTFAKTYKTMIMDFFGILRRKNKEHDKESNKVDSHDPIDTQQRMSEDIIKQTKEYLTHSNQQIGDCIITIYINNATIYQSCITGKYPDILGERIRMELEDKPYEIILKEGMLPNDKAKISIYGNSCITITLKEETKISCKARIRVTQPTGCGSLIDTKIILDSHKIQRLPGERMNIGIGRNPKLNNGIIRHNHIAIDDDSASPEYENNKYVSRAHAHICYDKHNGFILHVEFGGTPEGRHRTMVYSDNKETRLDRPGMNHPLKNGDQIVLSRTVTLIFENIE